MGSFVSRPDDLQTLSLPLSLRGDRRATSPPSSRSAGAARARGPDRLVPAAVQPVRDARAAHGRQVRPWEIALSVALLRRGHRGRGLRGGPDVRGGRPAVRPAPGLPGASSRRRAAPRGLTGAARQLVVERQAADQRQDRGRRPRRRRAHRRRPTGSGRRGIPGVAGHEAPEAAADPGQVRAHPLAGQDAGDTLGHGRVERAPGPRSRWPARPRPRRPAGAPRAASRAAGQRRVEQRAAVKMQQVEREERGRPALAAGQPGRERRLDPRGPSRRPRPAPRRGSRSGPPRARPCRPARGVPRTGPAPSASTIRTSPSPGASAGPMRASARTPPHHGSNRCSVGIERLRQRPRLHRPQVGQVREAVASRAAARAGRPSWSMVAPLDCTRPPATRHRGGPCPDRHAPTTCIACASPSEPRLVARRPIGGRDAPDRGAPASTATATPSGSSRRTTTAASRDS